MNNDLGEGGQAGGWAGRQAGERAGGQAGRRVGGQAVQGSTRAGQKHPHVCTPHTPTWAPPPR